MVDWRALHTALRDVAGQPLADADDMGVLEELCDQATRALEVAGVGVLLADEKGALRHGVSTGPTTEQLARVQVKTGEGPAWECVESGRPVSCEDLLAEHRWPAFTELAAETGLRSVACLPLSVADRCLGALSVVRERVAALDDDELEAGQALATAAAGFLRNLADLAEAIRLAEQLQTALRSRIVIEQAKGMLAVKLGTTPEEAFELLRGTARSRRERLHDLARAVIAGTADIDR